MAFLIEKCKMNAFEHYLEAKEARDKGDRDLAVKHLAQMFGQETTTPMLEANLDRILENGSMANRMITGGIFGLERSNRRKERNERKQT